jgi:hypothetical protein
VTAGGYGIYFGDDENVLELDNSDILIICEYTKSH